MRRLYRHPLFRRLQRTFGGLPQRAWLTYKYLGPREFVVRLVSFPLRLTPLARRFGFTLDTRPAVHGAVQWYRDDWRPVGIVIPTYGDPSVTIDAIKSIRATTNRRRVRIIVADDGS